MSSKSSSDPSPPAPLPEVEGSKKESVHYRGGFSYSGLVDIARELRKRETIPEKIIWTFLRNRHFLNLKFRRQHQIGLYVVDFYCDELKLILELDGSVHFNKEQKERDKFRDEYLKSEGFTVFRFENNVVLYNLELLFEKIEKLYIPPSPSGRGFERGINNLSPSVTL